jgi:hypothetical protein
MQKNDRQAKDYTKNDQKTSPDKCYSLSEYDAMFNGILVSIFV